MFRQQSKRMKNVAMVAMYFLLATAVFCLPAISQAENQSNDYAYWRTVGGQAAQMAVQMMRQEGVSVQAEDCIALTNAGYAQIAGRTTTGALDGLSHNLIVSRGDHSLVEIHSAADKALWFAVYHKLSGVCVYLQVDADAVGSVELPNQLKVEDLFSIAVLEQINADHLFAYAEEYSEKFNSQIFGGNEFRIVTIANAVTAGAPTYAVRSFEFHDHYCPGVTSGVLMALFIQEYFQLDAGGSYFVQTVQPWCKEDALLVMLNATPGKKGYAVTYPTSDDMAAWPDWAANASTIVYYKAPGEDHWNVLVLGYQGGDTGCPDYGHSVMNKLCSDLWYLNRLDQAGSFINVLRRYKLNGDVDPKSYARPGVDPIMMLDQLTPSTDPVTDPVDEL